MSNDHAKAVKKYAQFHRFDADVVKDTSFKIPPHMEVLGVSLSVQYVSTKIDPSTLKAPRTQSGVLGYSHDHDAGVNVYVMPVRDAELSAVPPFIRQVGALVQLGDCLGFEYDGGAVHYGTYPHTMRNLPGLFCTPCGHALLVISPRQKLLAAMWGGSLRVEARGIVG